MKTIAILIALSLVKIGFAADSETDRLKPALDAITADGLLAHVKMLASDEFEGRAPGSKGEELSVKYIADQFKTIGLISGNPDGTYFQEVPLAGIKSAPTASFVVARKTTTLNYPDDYVASSARLQNEIKVENSDIVFVGYGIVAPEYGWNDYKDVDVRGKTLLMLINDPPIPDPKDSTKLDEKMFGGRAMTYYGRWTYKYEIAAQKGAAAAIIIHETVPAAYPYSVVMSSWAKENFEIDAADKNKSAVQIRSWITLDVAKKLLADCGQDFDAPKRSVLFTATTAEEAGLLGAKFYAEHPLYPLEKTLADINMDGLSLWGKTRDIEDISFGNSDLDDMLAAATTKQGRVMNPNSQPEKGGFYRADNFEFSKVGLPSLYTGAGREVIGKPPEFGHQKKDEYVAKHYHQPSD